MTSENRKRLLLYPAILALLSGLVYGGFIYKAEPDAGMLVSSAEVLAQAGLLDEAVENAQRAIRQEPDNRYAHIILGYAFGGLGKADRSAEHYGRAVALSDAAEENTDALKLYYAEALIAAGRTSEAVAVAREVMEREEGTCQARFTLAQALIAEKKYEDARSEYEQCRKLVPENYEPVALLAALAEEEGKQEEALRLYREAQTLEPLAVQVGLRLSRVLARLDRDEEAVAELLEVAGTQRVRMQKFLFSEEDLSGLRTDERLLAACPNPPVKTPDGGNQ
jgi:tetratricopeptide (TPR) repeat protein